MKRIFSITVLSLLTFSMATAQEHSPCGIKHALEQVYQIDPDAKANVEALFKNSYVPNPEGSKKAGNYVIPVVFHILHQYGNENISDAQVYDAMKVINREYAADDADSIFIIDAFENNNANVGITFKLAAIDPFGNCTNGIDHIYSHETLNGDAYAKLNQWNRSKYLNIWVAKSTGGGGAAAYALYPSAVEGPGSFWMDGVMSLHYYVGSIGTSSPTNESTITHEIGHCLNLSHVWGDNNDPEVACGDDGVTDTPETMGYSPGNCPADPNNSKICDANIIEDYNNYMDYSYCNYHFTQGQADRMHNALEAVTGQRKYLWQDSTLIATGVKDLLVPQDPNDQLTVPLCAPIADFQADRHITCVGDPITFKDHSWNAVIDSREWTFVGGTPATSTNANVNVTWDVPGFKEVRLTVTNAEGSDTRTETSFVYVGPNWADYTGPVSMNMEGADAYWFIVENPEDNHGKFKLVNGVGYNGSRAYKLENYKDVSGADPYTADGFYYNRLGGSVDNLITPSMNLSTTTSANVSFKYSYATNATTAADITESLKVYASKDCGDTWTLRRTITGAALVTGGFASGSDYAPANNNQWTELSFAYATSPTDKTTRLKFEFTASDLSSNLYIDDINITGVLGVENTVIDYMNLTVYPNPSSGEAITVDFIGQDQETEFILRDVQGKIITSQVIEATNGQVNKTLDNTAGLPAACYFLEVKVGDHSTTKKVVVM